MKTQLLKKLTFVFALFAITSLSAQGPWTFDADLEGWGQNFGNHGTVAWDADSGEGALKLTRLSGNANFGPSVPNNGGGVDADAFNTIRIKIKNGSQAIHIRVGGAGGNGTNGNTDFNNVLNQASGVYQTIDLPMTGIAFWNGTLSNFWFGIRGNPPGVEGDIFVSSIELVNVTPLPPAQFSEFIANPNFEDITGLGHMSNTTDFDKTIIEAATPVSQNGDRHFELKFIVDPISTKFIFSNFAKAYTPNLVAASTEFTVKMWVKSAHTADIIVRLKNNDDGLAGIGGNEELLTDMKPVTGNSVWQELTFTFNPTMDVEQINFWFTVNVIDGASPNDPSNGDIFLFDNMTASIGTPLSIKGNTLEGVSIYPNPARDVLTLNTPRGGDITVYNILGAQVKSDKTLLKEYRMNVSDLKSGIYLLRVNSEGKQFTQKLVIQ